MSSVWNFAVGADIIGTIFFFFVARNDDFQWMILFVCFLCILSNLLWMKMLYDLRRSTNTLWLFGALALLATWATVSHWKRPVALDSDDEDEMDYDSLLGEEENEPMSVEELDRREEELRRRIAAKTAAIKNKNKNKNKKKK